MVALLLHELPDRYAICRANDLESAIALLEASLNGPPGVFAVIGAINELTIVCREHLAPSGADVEGNWVGIYIDGQLDFALVGILARLTTVLAEAGMGVLAMSTFDTDYVFIPGDRIDDARMALAAAGYKLADPESE